MINEVKNRLIIIAGAAILVLIGRQKFYNLTQCDSPFLRKLASYFCKGHLARLVHDYEAQIEGQKKERISDAALRLYSDDSLGGYGDLDFSKTDGKPLLLQQRGLIIPLVETEIQKFESSFGRPPRVLEIGVANGDVLVHLAERFPHVLFTGVDLSVKNAQSKYSTANVQFVKGYSLDLIAQRNQAVVADIVFGTSTFCAMVPREFRKHVEFFAESGASAVVISDPVTSAHTPVNDGRPVSKHMSSYMWWHNYAGYLSEAGYRVVHFETRNFVYSWNPHALVTLVVGRANRA